MCGLWFSLGLWLLLALLLVCVMRMTRTIMCDWLVLYAVWRALWRRPQYHQTQNASVRLSCVSVCALHVARDVSCRHNIHTQHPTATHILYIHNARIRAHDVLEKNNETDAYTEAYYTAEEQPARQCRRRRRCRLRQHTKVYINNTCE